MTKNRQEAWGAYHRTGVNNSNFDLNDQDEIAAITGWNCARDKSRAEAFRRYHCTGVNNSEYDLTNHDLAMSMLHGIKYRD